MKFAQTQQQAAELSQMLGNTAVDALSGIIDGSTTAEQALADLGKMLLKMALQSMLMGTGPLAGLGGGGGGGIGGLLGGIFGFARGGEVAGAGTSTSDSIPALLSNGEFVVNAKSTKRHRAALEAINSGRAPAFASGGIVGRNSFANSSTYAPSLNINVGGASGNRRADSNLASQIATAVDGALKANAPVDTFKRSDGQRLADMAVRTGRANTRNN